MFYFPGVNEIDQILHNFAVYKNFCTKSLIFAPLNQKHFFKTEEKNIPQNIHATKTP